MEVIDKYIGGESGGMDDLLKEIENEE